jgi:hypothetical protein
MEFFGDRKPNGEITLFGEPESLMYIKGDRAYFYDERVGHFCNCLFRNFLRCKCEGYAKLLPELKRTYDECITLKGKFRKENNLYWVCHFIFQFADFISRRSKNTLDYVRVYYSPRVKISWYVGPLQASYSSDGEEDVERSVTAEAAAPTDDSASVARCPFFASQQQEDDYAIVEEKKWEPVDINEVLRWMSDRKWKANCNARVVYHGERVY